jgi:hypothetical protein
MPVKIILVGQGKEFSKKNAELVQFVNSVTRTQVLKALGDLKLVTPVDTGRARNSWLATESRAEFKNSTLTSTGISATMLKPPSERVIETYYITNGVTYIDKLNAGSSKQAPARFIENTISRTFDKFDVTYDVET